MRNFERNFPSIHRYAETTHQRPYTSTNRCIYTSHLTSKNIKYSTFAREVVTKQFRSKTDPWQLPRGWQPPGWGLLNSHFIVLPTSGKQVAPKSASTRGWISHAADPVSANEDTNFPRVRFGESNRGEGEYLGKPTSKTGEYLCTFLTTVRVLIWISI